MCLPYSTAAKKDAAKKKAKKLAVVGIDTIINTFLAVLLPRNFTEKN